MCYRQMELDNTTLLRDMMEDHLRRKREQGLGDPQ
jgi:hypothetical protein